MSKKKRINPHKKSATLADVNKAKREVIEFSTNAVMTLALTVLHDKYGFGKSRLDKFMRDMDSLSDSINTKHATLKDLANELESLGVYINKTGE